MELFYPAKARLPPHKQRHHVRDCERDLAVGTFDLARVRSPIAVEELRIPMSALLSLQPRFPFGGLTISRCVDALTRQDLLDPLPYVRRHICGDWGDVRAEHRCYNDAALKLGGYLLSSYAYVSSPKRTGTLRRLRLGNPAMCSRRARYSLVAGNFSPAPVSSHCALTLNSPAILSSCECGIPRENQLVSRWGLIFRNSANSIGAILHSDNTTRRRTPENSALAARSIVDRRPVRASFSWP
ncbi:hypothetical protein [Pseudomonas lactis]|uniref:hypothetical protein n=1 Tax=Pseudomonas lactis TaxID=1615674 RepID=UPI001295BA8F|nr:hypothetical protein [Pseudomonas lactis]